MIGTPSITGRLDAPMVAAIVDPCDDFGCDAIARGELHGDGTGVIGAAIGG